MILSHNKGANASWCKGRPMYVVFFPTDVLSLIKVLAIKINLHSFINSVKLFTLYFTQCKVLRTNNQSRSLSPVWILGTHEQYIFQSGWFTQVVKRSQVPKQQIFTNTPGTDSFEKPLFFSSALFLFFFNRWKLLKINNESCKVRKKTIPDLGLNFRANLLRIPVIHYLSFSRSDS